MSHILLAIFPTHRLHAMSFKRAWGASRRFEGASSGDVEKGCGVVAAVADGRSRISTEPRRRPLCSLSPSDFCLPSTRKALCLKRGIRRRKWVRSRSSYVCTASSEEDGRRRRGQAASAHGAHAGAGSFPRRGGGGHHLSRPHERPLEPRLPWWWSTPHRAVSI